MTKAASTEGWADCRRGRKERGSLEQYIRHLDSIQAELTIYPEGCPEPWRSWLVQAHAAMCDVVRKYQLQSAIVEIEERNRDHEL